jgi:hypothetical protein
LGGSTCSSIVHGPVNNCAWKNGVQGWASFHPPRISTALPSGPFLLDV